MYKQENVHTIKKKKLVQRAKKKKFSGSVTNFLTEDNPLNLLLLNPPFPNPVEPLVYIMTAISSGLGPFRTKDAKKKS